MVYDWWRIIGKAWYYAQLYRLERGYEIFPEDCEYTASPSMMKIFDEKMENMLKNGVIVEAPYEELIWINPCHLVPKANGDMRLVMVMTKVNKFMKPITFKMEGTSTLSNLLTKNNYVIRFNLKEAYNHVLVHVSMQPLLELSWRSKCYKYLGMPFGLNDSPHVFTMIMRIFVCIIREVWNVKTEVYLGDLLLLPRIWNAYEISDRRCRYYSSGWVGQSTRRSHTSNLLGSSLT
jgi:hypothetical protein